MRTLIVDTKGYGWFLRYNLMKDKDGYVLKLSQYKHTRRKTKTYPGATGIGQWEDYYPAEIHIFGNKAVEKLRDFLVKFCKDDKAHFCKGDKAFSKICSECQEIKK